MGTSPSQAPIQPLTRIAACSLSGNELKVLAAVSMVIDHMGVLFFPGAALPRILGRFAMPIFAFMIAQGCQYTKNKRRYFGGVFLLALACQLVYYFTTGSTYQCILVTFSLSILLVFALQEGKQRGGIHWLLFPSMVAVVWGLNQMLTIDYGFWGCMLPVFASLFQGNTHGLDRHPVHVLSMGVGLLILSVQFGWIQMFSLLTLPLLLLYSGRRGKYPMKAFFYVFYPAHLVCLEGLFLLLN